MDLTLSADDLRFQRAVRAFFADSYPRGLLAKARSGQVLTRDDHVVSQRALQARGWLGISWPAAFGGPGWTPVQRHLFDEELARAGAPALIPMAILYIGPILCAFGSAEQQRRWLPDILASRAMWAQGYSEPEAGSDLAALTFSAERHGDDYILDGSKIWTTGAHWADWIFCLARTSPEARRQDGLSLICADMRTAGITVSPIVTIDGTHELNRVDFDHVRVPVANRIGEEGRAWHYAKVLLRNERLSYAHIARKKTDLARIRTCAAATRPDDAGFARRLAALEIEVDTLEISVLRALTGTADMGAAAILKIACTDCAQRITELGLELAGREGAAALDRTEPEWADAAPLVPEFAALAAPTYLFDRAQTIYGGTTEIQKAIAWRAIAGAS